MMTSSPPTFDFQHFECYVPVDLRVPVRTAVLCVAILHLKTYCRPLRSGLALAKGQSDKVEYGEGLY